MVMMMEEEDQLPSFSKNALNLRSNYCLEVVISWNDHHSKYSILTMVMMMMTRSRYREDATYTQHNYDDDVEWMPPDSEVLRESWNVVISTEIKKM